MLSRAHAKINLVLGIDPAVHDAQGYHRVRTVVCPLELADDVDVRLVPAARIPQVSCIPDPLPANAAPEDNLAWRAAHLMAKAFSKPAGISVSIKKTIPAQAGLAGGSSDAAAVIRALAKMWGFDRADDRIVQVAREVGSDVALFLRQVPAYLEGRGDIVCEYFAPFSLDLVLVKPACGVSTRACYRELDAMAPAPPDCEPVRQALRATRPLQALPYLGNNMEQPARHLAPELNEVFDFLESFDCLLTRPLLCGSGSCVAAFVPGAADADRIADAARARGWWGCATRTLSRPEPSSSAQVPPQA